MIFMDLVAVVFQKLPNPSSRTTALLCLLQMNSFLLFTGIYINFRVNLKDAPAIKCCDY